jgi:BASS family bile acid:Na+ symporter
MFMAFMKLIRNRDFLLFMAILLGLLWGQGAKWTEKTVLPALGLVMTLSTMGVPGRIFLSPGKLVRPALWGIALNYVILGGLILGLSALLITDGELRDGFVIMTAVPPAVAVIPFSVILNGNQTLSLIGTIGSYLAALGITPLIAYFFLGGAFGHPVKIVTIMMELILVPLMLSRVLLWTGWAKKLEPWRGPLTNWSFFLIVYTIIGLNRQLFLDRPGVLILPAVIALASTFLLGWVIEKIARLRGADTQTITSMVLLGTQKNTGLAAGLALSLFSDKTAVPATITTIFMLVYIIRLSIGRRSSQPVAHGS